MQYFNLYKLNHDLISLNTTLDFQTKFLLFSLYSMLNQAENSPGISLMCSICKVFDRLSQAMQVSVLQREMQK